MKNRLFVYWSGLAIAILIVLGVVVSSISSANYVKTAGPFFNSLLSGDVASARHNLFIPPNSDASLFSDEKLTAIANALKSSIGDRIEVKFDRSQKIVSTNISEATPEGTTRVYFDLVSNEKYLEVETLVNDQTQKIQYLNFSQDPKVVPSYVPFILLSILFLVIPILNVFAITRIRTNYDKGRIWRYLTVLLLNIPTVTYFALGSVNVNLLADQMFLGFAFDFSGLSQASVSIGLPLGALYWIFFSGRKQLLSRQAETENTGEVETEITWDCPKCKENNPNSTFKCQKCGYSLK